MLRGLRTSPPGALPAGGAGSLYHDDFGLTWVRDRIGLEEVRWVVVLAFAPWPDIGNPASGGDLRRRVTAIVERFGGKAEQTDDGVGYAAWGFARASAHDARLAGLAALAIVQECDDGRSPMRCGIVATPIAISLASAEGDACLDRIALRAAIEDATRIAEQAPEGGVLAQAAVLRFAAEAFEVATFGSGDAGRARSLYRLLARRPEYVDHLHTAAPRVLGRQQELDTFKLAWRGVRSGGTQRPLLVAGEAGIGKSTLVRAAVRRAAEEGALTVVVTCTPEARVRVAAPVEDLLTRLWYRAGQSLVPGIGTARCGGESWAFEAAVDAVLALARRRPSVLVVEDLHWADEPSVAFLTELSGRLAAGAPGLVLMMTGRNVPALLAERAAHVMRLGPLEAEHVMAIVDDAGLGGYSIAERLEIAACAGGNPLLALELARALPAAGRGLRSARTVEHAPLPGSLPEVLELRLGMLGPLKPLAQAASVFPNQVPAGVLAQMLAVDVRWLEPQLGALEEAGVLGEHTGRRGRWFRFKHAMLREAAYESLPQMRRRELNRLAAEALAARWGADRMIEPAAIADHFAAAGCREEAFAWWKRAADKASGEASLQAAVLYLRRALAIASDNASAIDGVAEVDTLRQLGVALIQARGSAEPEVRATYERALLLASSVADVPDELRFDLLWGFDAFLLAGSEVTRALEVGEKLMETAQRMGSRQRKMLACRMHAVAKLLTGNISEATALYRLALDLYEEASDAPLRYALASDQRVVAHAHLCWALSIAGDFAGAELHGREALATAGRLAHAHSSAHALGVLATAAQIRGDRGAAGAYAVAGRALAAQSKFPYWVAWNDIVLAWCVGGPAPEHGIRSIGEAIALYRSTGARQALPYASMLLADAELRRSNPRRALDAIAEARQAAAGGIRLWDSELDRLEAAARRELGCAKSAFDGLLRRAANTAAGQGAKTFAMRCSAATDAPADAGDGVFSRINACNDELSTAQT